MIILNINRKLTKKVTAGNLSIGGDSPVSIQSMTNVPIDDVEETVKQIISLKMAGANLVRLAVPHEDSIDSLKKIIKSVDIPLCADIHFNYKIAIAAIEAGISKVRINPGNIGDKNRVKEVVKAAQDYNIPIRIGVNGGSIDKKKYSFPTSENLVESALEHIYLLEENNFEDIVVSIKSSNLHQTVEANRILSKKRDYPIHVGLTEAGYGLGCTVQSSIAIGSLLMEGIGDTIRVSMTGDPVQEIPVARGILEAVGHQKSKVRIVACPTCGRTDKSLDILALAKNIEKEINDKFKDKIEKLDKPFEVAVMGCEVNGPGEASHADIGLAGGKNGTLLLFAKGEKLKKLKSEDAISELMIIAEKMLS